MKKLAVLLMILVLSIPIFTSANNGISDIKNVDFTYDEAIDSLYYLFWCKGEENIDQALNQFQVDFDLSDEDMEFLAGLIGEYQANQSKLNYATQNALEELEIAEFEKSGVLKASGEDEIDLKQNYQKKSETNHDSLSKEIQHYIDDKGYLAEWMSAFIKEDALIGEEKRQQMIEPRTATGLGHKK